jgi:hypothetical protein
VAVGLVTIDIVPSIPVSRGAGSISVDSVVEQVVVETARPGNPLNHLGDGRFGILSVAIDRQAVIVPTAVGNDLLESPRVGGDRRVDQARTVAIGSKREPAAIVSNFVSASSHDPVVVPGIQRKQDPQSAESVVLKNQKVPIGLSINLNPDVIALTEPAVVVHPEPDRCGGRRCGGDRRNRSAEQGQERAEESHGDVLVKGRKKRPARRISIFVPRVATVNSIENQQLG